MPRAALTLLCLATLHASPAAAQAHERVGRGTTAEGEQVVILWLTPGIAFSRTPVDSVCAGARCAPVIARETCAPPDCPTAGWRLAAAEACADVPRWSTIDRDAELEALLDDPEASTVFIELEHDRGPPPGWQEEMPNSIAPPEFDPLSAIALPAWSETERGLLGVELDASFTTGSFVEDAGAWVGASAGVSFLFELDRASSYGPFDALFFDSVGLGFRAHYLSRVDTGTEHVVALGAGVTLSNRVRSTAVRVPTLMGALLPEGGALLRSDGTLSGYVGWTLPFSLLLVPHFALDVRPRVLVTFFPEASEREADVFLGVSVGLVGAQIGTDFPRTPRWGWL